MILNPFFSTFNFSVPFLSYLAIILLIASCVLLYAVPLRYLILCWGVNKFTRKLFRPHSIPNNEALDFLSRVPDDEQLVRINSFFCMKPFYDTFVDKRRRIIVNCGQICQRTIVINQTAKSQRRNKLSHRSMFFFSFNFDVPKFTISFNPSLSRFF